MEDNVGTKSTSFKNFFIVSLFLVVVAGFYLLIGQDKTILPSQLIDRTVPKFQVEDLLDNSVIRSNTDFEGQITLLNVWASWCPACYAEHPYWEEYAKNKDVVLVGLNYRDSKSKALKFLKEQGDSFAWNIFDQNGRLGIEFGVYGAPETFVIDTNGKVLYRHVGVVTPEVFESIFIPMIEQIKKGL
ncbi:MAG: DsbE family thiol:disulfide interchange protein [Kangiellaceae bacterium]|nr:DsbE family thiol:disulfide interchange protein [Kangiellaceae bacterium]